MDQLTLLDRFAYDAVAKASLIRPLIAIPKASWLLPSTSLRVIAVLP
jgi:hypothetical protein